MPEGWFDDSELIRRSIRHNFEEEQMNKGLKEKREPQGVQKRILSSANTG
jgi:hypothetical protein